ncbi:MAG: cell division protein FtsL [Acidobacteria bacterium]|nr:cell division protein FtsL [Acidobacteriota bacterium]
MNRYYAQKIENAQVSKRPNPQATRQTIFVVLSSILVVAGFIYAISQHAEAVKDGYKAQQLMRLREQLEREKHRLELQRAYYRSPQIIEPVARRMGLVRPDSSQVIVTSTGGEFKRWMPIRTRPKRVEAAEASARTRIPEANAHGDETPKARLEGVLKFPQGQADLRLEKTRKRKRQ